MSKTIDQINAIDNSRRRTSNPSTSEQAKLLGYKDTISCGFGDYNGPFKEDYLEGVRMARAKRASVISGNSLQYLLG